MRKRLLVSGGTGFLGRHLVPRLRERFEVAVLSRSGRSEVKGDLTAWNAGLSDQLKHLGPYDGFVHLAGLYDLSANQTDCYLQNVLGTSQALKLAESLGIPVFFNTSSIAAAINLKSERVGARDINLQRNFPDAYSESKAQAERLVQHWGGTPQCRVNFRPGVLVGDTVTGAIDRLDGPYAAPMAFEKIARFISKVPGPLVLPGGEKTRIPLVPVDSCAEAMKSLIIETMDDPRPGYSSYQLVPEEGVSLKDFYESVLKHLLIRHHGVRLMDKAPVFLVKKISNWLLGLPEEQMTYLLSFPRYEGLIQTGVVPGNWCPEFSQYEKIFWRGYEDFISNR